MNNYTIYQYNGEDTTLIEYASMYTSLIGDYYFDLVNFINYKGNSQETNGDRMRKMYTDSDNIPPTVPITSSSLLKQGTVMFIDNDKIRKEFLVPEGKNLINNQKDQVAFMASKLAELVSDPGYVPIAKTRFENGVVSEISSNISVWIWSRALDKIIDISSFVINVDVTSVKLGSSFNINLPPISTLNFYTSDIFSDSPIRGDGNKRNDYFFMRYLSENDIVWIKFEKLEIEKNRKDVYDLNEVPSSELADQLYDFIGLIDNVSVNSQAENTMVDINVSGRDLTKLLIDDGAYFIPSMFTVNSAKSLFINTNTDDDRLIQRMFLSGDYQDLFSYGFKTIPQSLSFVINQLGKLGVLPKNSNLLNSYASTPQGDIRTYAYRSKNVGTSYKKSGNRVNIGPSEFTLQADKQISLELLDGLWQIIELVVDKSVENRSMIDSSLSMPDGSLISLFQKICQEPLVEFYTDTYGNKFNLIVREPPFTGKAIKAHLMGDVSVDMSVISKYGKVKMFPPAATLSISEDCVIDDSLSFTTDKSYSWYKYIPKESLFSGSASAIMDLPIVFFPEYAEVWGVKKLEVQSQYLPYQTLYGSGGDADYSVFIETVVNDLAWLIETNAYLPFTREGSITLTGDRRFKKGMWVRYEGTGEIFYVDAVTNSAMVSEGGVNRFTTLKVSRGMMEEYVLGKTIGHVYNDFTYMFDDYEGTDRATNFSYFNIIDINLIKSLLKQGLTKNPQDISNVYSRASNSGVNVEVFNFFLHRKQFE